MIKRRKGVTIVEILVALGIMTIVVTFLFSTLANTYKLMADTKKLTTDSYTTMLETEVIIKALRDQIKLNVRPTNPDSHLDPAYYPAPGINQKDVTLFKSTHFTTTVYGYAFTARGTESLAPGGTPTELYLMVGENTVPELPVSEIVSLDIAFRNFTNSSKISYYKDDLRVTSSVPGIRDPDSVHGGVVYQWYMSRAGFNIAYYDGIDDFYPAWPANFEAIQDKREDTFKVSDLDGYLNLGFDKYLDRHLVLVATPYSGTSGKMGSPFICQSVYLAGSPQLPSGSGNLISHLNAGLIMADDNSGILSYGTDIYVSKWANFSGSGYLCNAVQSDHNDQPRLALADIGNVVIRGQGYPSKSQSLRFDSTDSMIIDGLPADGTVFVVARADNPTIVLSGADSLYSTDVLYGTDPEPEDGWHILAHPQGMGFYFDGSVTIGGSGEIDVAEILIYDGVLSDEDYDAVGNYLKQKYGLN